MLLKLAASPTPRLEEKGKGRRGFSFCTVVFQPLNVSVVWRAGKFNHESNLQDAERTFFALPNRGSTARARARSCYARQAQG